MHPIALLIAVDATRRTVEGAGPGRPRRAVEAADTGRPRHAVPDAGAAGRLSTSNAGAGRRARRQPRGVTPRGTS